MRILRPHDELIWSAVLWIARQGRGQRQRVLSDGVQDRRHGKFRPHYTVPDLVFRECMARHLCLHAEADQPDSHLNRQSALLCYDTDM